MFDLCFPKSRQSEIWEVFETHFYTTGLSFFEVFTLDFTSNIHRGVRKAEGLPNIWENGATRFISSERWNVSKKKRYYIIKKLAPQW